MKQTAVLRRKLVRAAKTKEAKQELVPRTYADLVSLLYSATELKRPRGSLFDITNAPLFDGIYFATGVLPKRIYFVQPGQNGFKLVRDFAKTMDAHLGVRYVMDVILDVRRDFDRYLWARLRECVSDDFISPCCQTLRSILLSYIGFALIGDRERHNLVRQAVKMAELAIPLGESAKQPGTWLVQSV